jgi:hypothetical protein
MPIIDSLSSMFLMYQSPFYWRNVIEILFFASLFYYAARWLKKDRQKNLVLALYGYCTITFGAHFVGLTTISYVMFLFAPVVAMVFILLHQEFLQKNLIPLKAITPATRASDEWLETLIRTLLANLAQHNKLTCIIERRDSLVGTTIVRLPIRAHVEQGLLDLVITSPNFHAKDMIIITAQGTLIGVNTLWTQHAPQEFLDAKIQGFPVWKQDAIFFTSKTDALLFHINAESRTFDIVINGMVIDHINATRAVDLLKKYMVSSIISSHQEGKARENVSQKRVSDQHQS